MKTILDAVHLIDDVTMVLGGVQRSGWDYYDEGADESPTSEKGAFCLHTDRDKEVYLRRDCVSFEGGVMTFEGILETVSGDGLFYRFGSRQAGFVTLTTKGEALYAGEQFICDLPYGRHFLKLIMDMTADTFRVFVDDRDKGSFAYTAPVFPFSCLTIGFLEKARGSAKIFSCFLYVNYLFRDSCTSGLAGKMPDGYNVKTVGNMNVYSGIRVEGKRDICHICDGKAGGRAVIGHSLPVSAGRVTFEMKYLMEKAAGRITVSLLRAHKPVVFVYDEGEKLHCYDGAPLRSHHKNVWQTLRIEADTDAKQAKLWLNGKLTATVPFENPAKAVDAFCISYEAKDAGRMMFTDLFAWVKPEEPADYVPAPVVPKKKGDHIVGINVCSLWREGHQWGWDCISTYDDLKPVLGYYDEGLPEVADWEIKYLAEHGIDYELYCWYSSESSAPILNTPHKFAWMDGHFYAKYADREKFALLWEAQNCVHCTSLEDFKNVLVPYWLDYFFSDDRYMQVDNKAVMSCFGVWQVESDLGGEENVREGLQYLRDEVKKLGYDDLIVMGCHAKPTELKRLGFDASHAYHWGADSHIYENSINGMESNRAQGAVHVVPTVSVGFKNIGWGGKRKPMLPLQKLYDGVKYCVDTFLPKEEAGTWKAKMLHLSTWNEFGEGTYMMPSALNGFGYLDAVRKALCVEEPHEDSIPTAKQLKRLSYLRVQSRHILGRAKYDTKQLPENDTVVKEYVFDKKAWEISGGGSLRIENGMLTGENKGGPVTVTAKKFSLDPLTVGYVKIACPKPCHVKIEFAADETGTVFANNAFYIDCGVFGSETAVIQLDTAPWWNRKPLTGFRMTVGECEDLCVGSVKFCAPLSHKTLISRAGIPMEFGDYLMERDGELYIPLDPASGIIREMGYRHEWFRDEERLELYNEERTVFLKVGDIYLVKDGEPFTLTRPVFLKDGVPALALSDLETIFGLQTEQKGDLIYIR